MYGTNHHRTGFVAVAVMLLGLLAWPATAQSPTASTVTGQGTAVQATVLGILGTATTTTLADSGPIGGINDARDASMDTGSVPSLLGGEVLSATSISYPDEVDSAA